MADARSDAVVEASQDSVLTEVLLRGFAVVLLVWFIWNVGRVWLADTSRYSLLLLLATEAFTLVLVLFARRAIVRDMSPLSIFVTVFAVFSFALLDPNATARLVPEWVGASMQMLGLVWQVLAKATLGRSFGLLPASRGLVTTGPYRVVRHPIYLGYLISHVGFVLTNASIQNMVVIFVLYGVQAVRVLREENMLEVGEQRIAYSEYRAAVKYRIVPLVF